MIFTDMLWKNRGIDDSNNPELLKEFKNAFSLLEMQVVEQATIDMQCCVNRCDMMTFERKLNAANKYTKWWEKVILVKFLDVMWWKEWLNPDQKQMIHMVEEMIDEEKALV